MQLSRVQYCSNITAKQNVVTTTTTAYFVMPKCILGHKSLTFLLKVLLFSKKLLSLWPVSIKVVRNPLKKVVCLANLHKLALKGGM